MQGIKQSEILLLARGKLILNQKSVDVDVREHLYGWMKNGNPSAGIANFEFVR